MIKINLKSLAFHLLVPLMLSFIIWMLIPDYLVYYDGLKKPIPQLGSSFFVYIWTFINFIMGIAAYVLENTNHDIESKQKAFNAYFFQLLLNLLWLPLFLGFHSLVLVILLVIILLVLVFITYKRFSRFSIKSSYLFLIYLLWLVFLLYYTIGFWILNK